MTTNSKGLTLEELLVSTTRKASSKTVVAKKPAVERLVSGVYKIPSSDKPFSIFFVEPLRAVKQKVEVSTSIELDIWLSAFFSKFPHYEYLKWTRCNANPKQYWFKDTSRNITVILTREEIERRIK